MTRPHLAVACVVGILGLGLIGPASSQKSQQIQPTDLGAGQVIVAGKWRKAAPGPVDIPFGITFSEPPIVMLTPYWSNGVGFIDTVTRVDRDRFQVTSGNNADNYFVGWMAIGKR